MTVRKRWNTGVRVEYGLRLGRARLVFGRVLSRWTDQVITSWIKRSPDWRALDLQDFGITKSRTKERRIVLSLQRGFVG